jgi:hypothetical protein
VIHVRRGDTDLEKLFADGACQPVLVRMLL